MVCSRGQNLVCCRTSPVVGKPFTTVLFPPSNLEWSDTSVYENLGDSILCFLKLQLFHVGLLIQKDPLQQGWFWRKPWGKRRMGSLVKQPILVLQIAAHMLKLLCLLHRLAVFLASHSLETLPLLQSPTSTLAQCGFSVQVVNYPCPCPQAGPCPCPCPSHHPPSVSSFDDFDD